MRARGRGAFCICVLVILATVLPATASAKPEYAGGCPQGYIALDGPAAPGGGPPTYPQGGMATASGSVLDKERARTVTVRWGSSDGRELGRAAVDAEGSWGGVSFSIPAELPDGVYELWVEATDAEGSVLTGFPFKGRIGVGQVAGAAAFTERAPAPRTRTEERDPAAAAPGAERAQPIAPAVSTAARARPPVVAQPLPAVAASSAPAPQVESGVAAEHPRVAPRPTIPAPGPRPGAPSPRPEAEAGVGAPLIAGIVAALLLGLGAVGVLARRPRRGPLVPAVGPAAPLCPPLTALADAERQATVEAALQEMLSEEHAREVLAGSESDDSGDRQRVPVSG